VVGAAFAAWQTGMAVIRTAAQGWQLTVSAV